MVVGPILDALAARKAGTSAVHVLNKGNRLLIAQLSLRVRLIFWLTNVPYFGLAARLAASPAPLAGSWNALHALAVLVVALVSTAFHGAVLFGGGASSASYQHVTSRLLLLDLIAANGYGIALSCYAGLAHAAVVFTLPVAMLTVGAVMKRRGQPLTYAWMHGLWHLSSAACLGHILYRS